MADCMSEVGPALSDHVTIGGRGAEKDLIKSCYLLLLQKECMPSCKKKKGEGGDKRKTKKEKKRKIKE